ncbi:unnamed protein product [Rotaria sordida]|uniref:Uncharacterized protein n=1 Tax=Rotaria sordida TaxID=392033 RepID=A0A815T3A4_9BILA|nr:unnamed protein product [Rotaria sordida]CAF3998415.1 unnamed protein product [Rotaria sordida]
MCNFDRNNIYSWRPLRKEIYPAIVYQWFEWSIKTSVVNLQLKFADCPYRPNEPWALQQALLYTYGMFIDKSITVNNGQRN